MARPYDDEAKEVASQILHSLRKPAEARDEDDRDYIIDKAEELAELVKEDGEQLNGEAKR